MGVDPGAITTRAEMSAALGQLHTQRGATYTALVADSSLASSTVHAAVSGESFPTWATLRTLLRAYGVHERALPAWEEAHKRAAADNRATRVRPGPRPARIRTAGPGAARMPGPRLEDMVVRVGVDATLPRVQDLNPYQLFATPSNYGHTGESGARDPYVPRDVDAELGQALCSGRFVLVVGPSKAGKSRTLFEAVRTELPDARIVVPTRETLAEIATCPQYLEMPEPVVVWLENLDEFLTGTQALTPRLLTRLTTRPVRTVVVATLRSEIRDRLRSAGGGELVQDTRHLLHEATEIPMRPTSDNPLEQTRAAAAYPNLTLGRYGLGEILAGAPELLRRYDDARTTDPLLWTVVQIAIDWARIGHPHPIPQAVLTDLVRAAAAELEPHRDIYDHELLTVITAARNPIPGGGRVPMLMTYGPTHARAYRPFDYLTAADDQPGRIRAITDDFWGAAAAAISDPEALLAIGLTARLRNDRKNWHETYLRRAIDAGSVDAMTVLAIELKYDQDELAEAETWFRQAADAGNLIAMLELVLLLVTDQDELAEAETWYRRATDAYAAQIRDGAKSSRQAGELLNSTPAKTEDDTDIRIAMFTLASLLKHKREVSDMMNGVVQVLDFRWDLGW